MEPTTLLPAIALLSLVTVESGGWALLGFITARRGALDAAQHQAFRAGHAHAGVLLVLAVAAFALFDRAELGQSTEWVLGSLLLAGILAQSGGFFLHLAFGAPARHTLGTRLTRAGAILIAVSLTWLAIGLLRA